MLRLRTAGVFVLMAVPCFAQQAAAPPPALIKVRDDVYVIQNVNHVVTEIRQNGGNATVLLTSDGVVLVDTKNERMHDDLRQLWRRRQLDRPWSHARRGREAGVRQRHRRPETSPA